MKARYPIRDHGSASRTYNIYMTNILSCLVELRDSLPYNTFQMSPAKFQQSQCILVMFLTRCHVYRIKSTNRKTALILSDQSLQDKHKSVLLSDI